MEAAAAVEVGQIARPEPAIGGESLGGGRVVVVVPLEQDVALQLEASAFSWRRVAGAIQTADAHLDAGHALSERGKLILLGVVPARALGIEDAPSAGFGHAKGRLEHVGRRAILGEQRLESHADLDDVGLAAGVEEQSLEVEVDVQRLCLASLELPPQLSEQEVRSKGARDAVATDEVQEVGRVDEHIGRWDLDLRDARRNGEEVTVDEIGNVVHVHPREERAAGIPQVRGFGLAAEGSEELLVRQGHGLGVAAAP